MLRYLQKTVQVRRSSSRQISRRMDLDLVTNQTFVAKTTSWCAGSASSTSHETVKIFSEEYPYPGREPRLRTSPQCDICMDLDLADFSLLIRFHKLAEFLGSGCPACKILYTALKPWEEVLNNIRGTHFWLMRNEMGLYIEHSEDSRHFRNRHIELVLQCVKGFPSPWPYIPERPMTRGINSLDIATQTISRWMKVCKSSHACSHAMTSALLPKRVLEIQGPDTVRLHLSTANEMGAYSCLSHRWGGVVPLRLTSSTIERFQTGIPWHDMPATFQQAIQLNLRLAIRYLWIDSLCILQDDLQDWTEEGSKMATIYSGATLTIAATASLDSTCGLFRSFDSTGGEHDEGSPIIHGIHDQTGMPFKIRVKPGREFAAATDRSLPLQRRAWFFQEWVLSPRIVHFTDSMLYWECSEMQELEDGSLMTEKEDFARCKKNVLMSWTQPVPVQLSSLSRGHIQTLAWHGIARTYSCLDLTYSTDVFPALQGVTTRMAAERKCTFYAGLWEDSLVIDLLWRLAEPSCQIVEHRAPSWSWVSQAGEVIWQTWRWLLPSTDFQTFLIPEVSIISASVETAGGNPFGQVSGGILVLRGLCLPAMFGPQRGHDGRLIFRVKIDNLNEHEDLLSTDETMSTWHLDTEYKPEPDADILVMLIGLWPTQVYGRVYHESWFLVFERVSNVDDVYRRIGLYWTERLVFRVRFLREAIEQALTII